MFEATEIRDPDGIFQDSVPPFSRLRWWIITLVFLATVINILDRLSVAVLAPIIRAQLHLTNLHYAEVGTWFLLAYTLSQGLSGLMHDRIGAKRGFAFSISLWSTAALLHTFARSFGSLCAFRVLLGLGEGGNWPGAVKVITEWFPHHERAFALGIVNAGSSVGAIIAPPVIVWLQLEFGWRSAFLATGSLGFIWLAAWLVLYRSYESRRQPGSSGLGSIQKDRASEADPAPGVASASAPRRAHLLASRRVWAIFLARLLADPIWWFYIFWLPEYLNKSRGISMQQIGVLASLPFFAAGIGGLVGGGLSGYLIRRGWSTNRARKTVIVLAASLMPLGILAAHAATTAEALTWISVVTFGFQVWINNVQILPSDIFPSRQVASVAGLGGVGAGIGSMAFTLTTGWVVDHFSYTPILITAGLLCPVGTILLFALLGRIEPIQERVG